MMFRRLLSVFTFFAILAMQPLAFADDCDNDGIDDATAIADGLVPDCNDNGVPDSCDIYIYFTSFDFDDSGTPDECDIADGLAADCNENGLIDWVDIFGAYDFQDNFHGGTSADCDNSGVPDECEADCNGNGVNDLCELRDGTSTDCDGNGIPDECDLAAGAEDCNLNGVLDYCDVNHTLAFDSDTYSFTQAGVIPPIDIKAGDVNNDGMIDLVTANRSTFNPWSLGVFLNQGGGVFSQGTVVGPGVGGEALALADLDGDSDLDVAICDRSISTFYVGIYTNDGEGNFTLARTISAGQVPIDIAAADLDGDSDLDLAVADINGNQIVILRNNGNATFTSAFIPIGARPLSVVPGDYDGDNDIDLAVCSQTEAAVKILMNNGNGTFAAPVVYPMGNYYSPTGAAAADFDGDGDLDLAIELQYSRSLGIMMNNGDGTFAPVVGYGPCAGNPVAISVGDFDSDNDPDVAVCLSPPWPNGAISIFRNDSYGAFLEPTSFFAGYSALSLATGDFDNDSHDDLATGVYQELRVRVLLNRSLPPVSPDLNANSNPDECDCPGDLNGDFLVDLADLALLLSGFGTGTGYGAGDLDYDGDVDIADLAVMLSLYGTTCG
jgi:hypothetical protein